MPGPSSDPCVPNESLPAPGVLRRRNALWQRLRQAQPGSPDFEAATFEALLLELSALIHWSRERVLAGLGLDRPEEP